MTLRRQSTSSSFIDINDPQSLDYLFQTNAVSDIRSVHLRIRNDVEAKKKELRGLVGDRYKDVLHASDSISLMKSTVAEVQNKMEMLENVLKFEEIRDQNESSQSGLRESSLNHSSGNGRASDDKIYILSTQLHLLVSIPEQIYNAVESNDYLRAAQVFLVGRLLYKKLESGNSGDENVMAQFPIIQRQWDTISHLRGLIVTKVLKYLERLTEDSMGTLNSLLAVHLLDSQSSFSTCLQKLLESRKQAINRILSTSSTLQASKDTKPTENVTRVLCELSNVVMKTLQEVYLLFISPPSTASSSHVSNETDSKQPLIQSYITMHTRSNPPSRTPSAQLNFDTPNLGSNPDNVSSANKEFRQTLSPLLKLFSSIPNIHLYHRYLPPQIQNFNPLTTLIHRRLKKSEQGSQGPIEHEFNDIVKEMVKNWVNEIEKLVAGNVDGVVGGLHNGGDIVEVEREVKEWIYTMETKNGHDSQWNMVLSSLLPSYSIYETLIYPSLFNRSTQIIESALSKLSTFHSTMYIPLSLADLLTNPNSPLQHYTSNQDKKFVWDVLSQLSPSQQQAVLFGWDWTRSIQSQSQTLSRRQTLLSPLMGKETDKWMGTELERIESKLYHPIVMMLVEEFHIMVNEIQQSIGDLIFVSSKSSNHEPTIAKPLNSKSLRNDAKSVYESELVKRFQEFCKHLSNRCQIETPHLACTIFVSHFTKTLLTHSRSLQLLSSSLPQPNSSGLNPPSNDPDNLTKVLKKELSKLYYTVTLAVLNRIVENNVTLLSVSSMKDDSSPVSELKEWAGTEFGEIEIEIEVGNSTTDAKTGGENAEGSGTGVESGTGSGTDKVKQVVELPVSCSIRLIKMLSRVVKDVDRIVGWDCESFILHEFLLGFANSLLSSYKSFATTFTNPSSVSSSPSSLLSSKDLQKLKLQLLFDIDYLTKLFDGVVSRNVSLENLHSRSGFGETDRERSEFGEEDQGVLWLGEGGGDLHGLRMKMYEVKKMGAEVQELVRGLIDPIDFLHFRSHLSGLVDRYYQRTVLMFGVFTVFNSSNDFNLN
ncbi:hypothetical protein BKA69DRAFT_767654 [Paraphysoderma sedebokerense]|nr:hypothetical protein BKA69DRAFT_767654 [Paraphysoderma sedebokerense]